MAKGYNTQSLGLEPFAARLARLGRSLTRGRTTILQINLGPLCNQLCRHCHLDAGPHREETMSLETMGHILEFARRARPELVDITGGAPELNRHLPYLICSLASLAPKLMVRTNLTALAEGSKEELIRLFRANGVVLVASFPSSNPAQLEAQRGKGILGKSVEMLRLLNQAGYGLPDSGLELDLVSNPSGAFLPPQQEKAQEKFRQDLERKWGISFNRLFTFANVPLGRFGAWLTGTGNLQSYMQRLALAFNPCTLDGLMCRSLMSVSWDGHLFDCDFNLAAGLPMGGMKRHVSELNGFPEPGTPIAVADHCYACTAGSGFT
jgi:radical SAM/Cys-rich protein